MPHTLPIRSKGRPCDLVMLCFYAIFWGGHLVLGLGILSGGWFSTDGERSLILAWCALIVALIPPALLAMRRTQVLEVTEQGTIIIKTGIPLFHTVKISRSQTFALNLQSSCWGAYNLLILQWGSLPWQFLLLAPLASTDEKKSIGKSILAFLDKNQIGFISNLSLPSARDLVRDDDAHRVSGGRQQGTIGSVE